MGSVKVTFQPEGTSTEAHAGERLIDIASYAGIDINTSCGGQGICGKCRVRITKGKVTSSAKPIALLNKDELQAGFVLACQASTTQSDVELFIPPGSRSEDTQILVDDHIDEIIHYGVPTPLEEGPDIPGVSNSRPLCRKICLELPEPTLTDSLSDLDRVYRELRKQMPDVYLEAHFSCLWGLATLLRQCKWRVTATVHLRKLNFGQIRVMEPGDTSGRNYGIAVDVGTTTIVAQLIDLASGKAVAVEASHNRQGKYGEDVISRMIFACGHGGLAQLNEAVVSTINSLIDSLTAGAGITPDDITCLVAAGNPTMTHLLLNLEPCNIRVEPYIPTANRFPQFQTMEIGLRSHHLALLHCMPCVSSYVGGDITAGVLASGMSDQPRLSALIDVGTNGEIVIGNSEWLICCSSSAGPAFEGGGIRCGIRATRGAIEKVRLEGDNVELQTIGGGKPRGICGSGLIDAVAELLSEGIIDQRGKFIHLDHPRVRIMDDTPEFILADSFETDTGEPMFISEDDIGNLIKSKGAVLAAVKILLDTIGMSFGDLENIYVAGGFGAHLDIERAIFIGLLPDIPKERIRFIGNSSLAGARLAMLSAAAFRKAESIASRMTYVELSVHPEFMNEFIAALFLPHTQLELFPSVTKGLAGKLQNARKSVFG